MVGDDKRKWQYNTNLTMKKRSTPSYVSNLISFVLSDSTPESI